MLFLDNFYLDIQASFGGTNMNGLINIFISAEKAVYKIGSAAMFLASAF